MKLLSAPQVVQAKIDTENKKLKYIKSLHKQEADLLARLNHLKEFGEIKRLKEFTAQEKKRLSDELDKFIMEIDAKKKNVLDEVVKLEKRKKEALKPILETKEYLNKLIDEASCEREDYKREREQIRIEREDLVEQVLDYSSRSEELSERFEDANNRDAKIKESERLLLVSANSLTAKWNNYYKAVEEFNKKVLFENKDIVIEKESNKNIKNELEAEKRRIELSDLSVQDKYKALEQAKKHLGIV
jgi:hypothetical protein